MSRRLERHKLDWLSFGVGPQRPGTVALIGAGPGDPALITIRGAARVATADVILYDMLANPALLALAGDHCEIKMVAKRPGARSVEQSAINETLVRHAQAGRRVVRLKGGDAFMFSRGGEEAMALAEAGIRFEVVPGVTSGIAAPICAGIPITKRGTASTIAFVTGHKDPTRPKPEIDYEALARMDALAIYMGMKTLEPWQQKLLEVGKPSDTPVAVVQAASRPVQQTVIGTLGNIVEKVSAAGLEAPVIIFVGQVVADRDAINWFENRPLFGQCIVNTRPVDQAVTLTAHLAELGAEVLCGPTIETTPPDDLSAIDDALRGLGRYDWLILTSANGVRAMIERLGALSLDARALGGLRIAAIGPATADRLRDHFIEPDLVPDKYVAEALADALKSTGSLAGQRILLLRADIARKDLPRLLTDAGAHCNDVTIYRTIRPAELPPEVLDRFDRRGVDWVTFTSGSTVENFLALLGEARRSLLEDVKLASIGPITSDRLRAAGLAPTIEADPYTTESLAEAIANETVREKTTKQ